MQDDRVSFVEQRRVDSIALGRDEAAFTASIEALVQADRFRYAYLWTWLGIPIIQLPADVMATQEVIWECKPDVIIETGVARGGSVIFMASLLEMIGNGKVVGVDIDIRAHNESAVKGHPLAKRVELIEGPSTSEDTLSRVRRAIPAGAKVMVVLDSDHSYAHVLDELRCYGPLVTPNQYLVVADTLLGRLTSEQTPKARSQVLHAGNDPLNALQTFLAETIGFEVDEALNGKLILSSSPGGYVRRVC